MDKLIIRSRYLSFLMIAYSMVYVAANWFDPRLIRVFGLNTGAGALVFPLTYVILDMVTEVYGYKSARLAIWTALLFNVIFLVYGQIINHFPSPDNVNNFSIFLHFSMRVTLFSIVSYLVTESLNSYIVAKVKVLFAGRYLGIRFLFSTFSAHAVNLLIFCPGAFYGVMSNKDLIYFMVTSWIFIVCIELLLLPVSIRLAKKLKKIEQLDIYDKKTNFNIFSLDTTYTSTSNKFKRK